MRDDISRHKVRTLSRRSYLAATGAAGIAGLAGCNSGGSSGDSGSSGDGTTTGGSSEPIKVGVLLPFSGNFANLGEAFNSGLKTALNQAYDGKIDGREVEMIQKDSKFSPETAVTLTQEMIQQDNVDFIAGPVGSSVALAIRPIIDQAGSVNWININAATNDLLDNNCTPYHVRVSYNVHTIGAPMGPWTYENLGKSAVIGVMDYNYGQALGDEFRAAYEEAGGTVVNRVATQVGTSDFAPVIQKIASTDADVFFGVYSGSESSNFLKAAADFGLPEKMDITGFGLVGRVVQGGAPKAMQGIPSETLYSTQIDTEANQRYLEQYDTEVGGRPPQQAVFGYDGMTVIHDSVVETGSTDPTDIIPFLRGYSWQSPRGDVSIDKTTQDIVTPMFISQADGPNPEDINITHTFDPVPIDNSLACDVSGTLQ